VIKSYNPEWKEVLLFTDMFPPLCNRIKIQLCDSDITSDEVIATHFIQLSQIMDPGGDSEGNRARLSSKVKVTENVKGIPVDSSPSKTI